MMAEKLKDQAQKRRKREREKERKKEGKIIRKINGCEKVMNGNRKKKAFVFKIHGGAQQRHYTITKKSRVRSSAGQRCVSNNLAPDKRVFYALDMRLQNN